MLITDSVAASWIDEGEIRLGGLPVVVKDGIARLKEGGALAGSALRYHDGLRKLVEITGRPLSELVQVTSLNQARSLGLEGFGRIEPGFHADLVVLDDDFAVWKTLVGGEER
jgi:N-acetylglucosamine-6-phosphate deacetylase